MWQDIDSVLSKISDSNLTLYTANAHTTQSELQIQCHSYENPNCTLFAETEKILIHVESQSTQNNQNNLKKEKWR